MDGIASQKRNRRYFTRYNNAVTRHHLLETSATITIAILYFEFFCTCYLYATYMLFIYYLYSVYMLLICFSIHIL